MGMGALLLVATFALIVSVTQLRVVPQMTEQVNQQAQIRLSDVASQLGQSLTEGEVLTQSMALLAQSLPLDKEAFNQHLPALIDQFGDGNIAGGGIWPEPGAFATGVDRHSFFWSRDSAGKLNFANDYNDPAGGGYHNEGWYTVGRSLSAGQCAWSEAYQDPGFPPMVTCTVAIKRQGSFWGVATVDLMLSGLQGLFEQQNAASGGYVFAVDQIDQVVSFPGIRSADLNMTPLADVVSSDASLKPLQQALGNGQMVQQLPEGVVEGDASTLVLKSMPEQGWTLGLVMPDSVALEPVNDLAIGLYVTLLPFLAVFVGGIVLYARRVLSWVENTTGQIRLLNEGGSKAKLSVEKMDEIGQLQTAVNDYGEHLSGIQKTIAEEAVDVRKNAQSLNNLSSTLQNRAAKQMDENNTLAAAIDEMSASAQQVSDNTHTAAETAQQATEIVAQGSQVINQTGEATEQLAKALTETADVIQRLSQDSQQVGAVLDVIKSISEQTNLLALNAAIEAARAGEQGRGFAVVADEVRTLAGRTSASASEIEQMIAQLQDAAQQGVAVIETSQGLSDASRERAEKARQSFEDIVEAFSNINERTDIIAVAADEQARVSAEIGNLAERIRTISEQNADDANELSEMSAQADEVSNRLYKISRS